MMDEYFEIMVEEGLFTFEMMKAEFPEITEETFHKLLNEVEEALMYEVFQEMEEEYEEAHEFKKEEGIF